jgi:UTP:GlnB (protein PII) uridylyltransferase
MTRKYTGLMDQTPSRYFLRTPAKKVSVNNQASDFFTVIEVSSAEQPGLLYHLAKKLFSLELDIRFARVHTDKERMTGVFYVSDPGGQKVQAEKQIEGIKEGILTLMDQYLPGIILWGLWVSVCQSLESDSI